MNKPTYTSQNLTYATSDAAVLRVDTSVGPDSEPNASTGRFSVRVTSKTTYNKGLFIFDIRHTPYGCGTWPALWLTDPSNWPDHGEIDVLESVNQGTNGNQMTLHTSSDCSMSVKREQTGKTNNKNCDSSKDDNSGCGVVGDDDSYGEAFNKNEGGVMALEWREAGLRMWQFARHAIPKDITNKSPTPDSWGTALADFPSTDCNIGSHFKNQSIVTNIDLCGDLVYAVYDDSGCKLTDSRQPRRRTLTKKQARATALISLPTTLMHSTMLTGSLVTSRCTRLLERLIGRP